MSELATPIGCPHWQYASVLGHPDIVAVATGNFSAFTNGI